MPSAAAPGAMPAADPGVSSMSDAWKIRPWSAGWSAYPPAVPFVSAGASPPAQLARPWRQVGIAVPRNADEVPVKLEDMTHEPLAFLSGTFKGSQMRWATIDKEGFAIVSTFRRLEHFLSNESTFSLITSTLLTFLTLKRA